MKVLPFTILVPDDRSIVSEEIELPHFYPYLHRHDEWQITWVQEGEGTLIAGSNMHSFRTGDIFLIGANLPHLFKSNPAYFDTTSERTIKACSLYFNPVGLLRPLFSMIEMRSATDFFNNHKHGFKIPASFVPAVSEGMLKVHRSAGKNLINNLLYLLDELQAIDTSEPLCSDIYSTKISENEGIRLSNIINYIIGNYNKQITLNDVASEACMTPHAFCRYFKQHTGHTFVTFLNEVRINDACKALTSGNMPDQISHVAYKAGFNSITNFNRVFKKVVGKAPSAYIAAYSSVSGLTD